MELRSGLGDPRVAKEEPDKPRRAHEAELWNSGPLSHVKLWGHDPGGNEKVVSRAETDPILSFANDPG